MPARHAEHLLIGHTERLANAHIDPEGAPIRKGNPNGDRDKNVHKYHDQGHRRGQD